MQQKENQEVKGLKEFSKEQNLVHRQQKTLE